MKPPTKESRTALADTLKGIVTVTPSSDNTEIQVDISYEPTTRIIDGIIYDREDNPLGFVDRPAFEVRTAEHAEWCLARWQEKAADFEAAKARYKLVTEAAKKNNQPNVKRLEKTLDWFKAMFRPQLELFGLAELIKANAGKPEDQKVKNWKGSFGRIQFVSVPAAASVKPGFEERAFEFLREFPGTVTRSTSIVPGKEIEVRRMVERVCAEQHANVDDYLESSAQWSYGTMSDVQKKIFHARLEQDHHLAELFDYTPPGTDRCDVITGVTKS